MPQLSGLDSTALKEGLEGINTRLEEKSNEIKRIGKRLGALETSIETHTQALRTAQPEVQKHRAFNRKLYIGAFVIGLLIPAASSVFILMLAPSAIPMTLLTFLGGPSITISALALSVMIPSVTALLTGITTLLIKKNLKKSQQTVTDLTHSINTATQDTTTLLTERSALTHEQMELQEHQALYPSQAQIDHHKALEQQIESFHQTPSQTKLLHLLDQISAQKTNQNLKNYQKATLFKKLFKLDQTQQKGLASQQFLKQLLSKKIVDSHNLMGELFTSASHDHFKSIQRIFQDQDDEVQGIETSLQKIEALLDEPEPAFKHIIQRCDRLKARIEGGTVPAISDKRVYESAGVFDPTTARDLLTQVQRIRFKANIQGTAQDLQSMLEKNNLENLAQFEVGFKALKSEMPESVSPDDQLKLTTQRIEKTLEFALNMAEIARNIDSFKRHPGDDNGLDALQLKINAARQKIKASSDLNPETQKALFQQLDVRQQSLSEIQTKSADPIKGSPEHIQKMQKTIEGLTQKAEQLDPTKKMDSKQLRKDIQAAQASIQELQKLSLDETTQTDLQRALNVAQDLVEDKRTERKKVKIEQAIQAVNQEVHSLQPEHKKFKNQVDALQTQIKDIKASIEDATIGLDESTQTDLQTQLGSTIQRLDAKDEAARHINQVKIEKAIQAVNQEVHSLQPENKKFKNQVDALQTQIKDIQASIKDDTIGLDESTQTDLKTALRQAQAALKQQELRSTVEKPLRGATDALASILDLKSQSSNDPNERTFQEYLAVFEYDLEALQEAIQNPGIIKDEGTRALVTQLDAGTHARLQEKYIEAQQAEIRFEGRLASTQHHIGIVQEAIDAPQSVLDAGTQALLKAEFNIIEQIAAVNQLTFELVSFDANTPPKRTEHQEKLTKINELIRVIESAIEAKTELADSTSVTLPRETQDKLKAQLTLAQKHIDQACIHRLTVSPKQQILALKQEVQALVSSDQAIPLAEYKKIYEQASRIKGSLKGLDQSTLSSIGLSSKAQASVLSERQGLMEQLAEATLCASVSDLETQWDKKTLLQNIQAARAQPITARIQAITQKVEALDPTKTIKSQPLTKEIKAIRTLIESEPFASALNQKTQSGLNTQLNVTTALLKAKKTKRRIVKTIDEITKTIDEITKKVTKLKPKATNFKNDADALRSQIQDLQASIQDSSTIDLQAQDADDTLHTRLETLTQTLDQKEAEHLKPAATKIRAFHVTNAQRASKAGSALFSKAGTHVKKMAQRVQKTEDQPPFEEPPTSTP